MRASIHNDSTKLLAAPSALLDGRQATAVEERRRREIERHIAGVHGEAGEHRFLQLGCPVAVELAVHVDDPVTVLSLDVHSALLAFGQPSDGEGCLCVR